MTDPKTLRDEFAMAALTTRRPTEADIGAIVWPVWRVFLDSDLTVQQLAEKIGRTPREIERAFLNPAKQGVEIFAAIAYGLDRRLRVEIKDADAMLLARKRETEE